MATKAVIKEWSGPNDKFVRIKYTQDDGQRVDGWFMLSSWNTAPANVVKDVMERLSHPPVAMASGGARATLRRQPAKQPRN